MKAERMFPDETPLFSEDAAKRCPSARYVGGVSGWLCECSHPTGCIGVFVANAHTRKAYLSGDCTHAQYYGQFLTPAYVLHVGLCIGTKRITESTHEYFNDIPLKDWDVLSVPTTAAERMRAVGDFVTPAGCVSLAKAAASQIREKHAKPRDWRVAVSYRPKDQCSGLQVAYASEWGTVDGIASDYRTKGNIDGRGSITVVSIDFTPGVR